MNSISSNKSGFPPRWNEFLKLLTERLSKPTQSLLSVRCLNKTTLTEIFVSIQKEINLPTTYPSGTGILDLLIAMGLANRIPVNKISNPTSSKEFFSIGIQEADNSSIDPLELLQAYYQSGIICYFSALSRLDLTTQIGTHHHIAIPIRQPSVSKSEGLESSRKKNTTPSSPGRSKLGTAVFYYQDIPFYSTKRYRNNIPGINIRVISPRAHIRMTTIEQTLLDSLQYPYHCGGPDSIFEAWKNGLELIDEDLLNLYLRKIDIPPLTRRTGAIFDLLDHRPNKKLDGFLKSARLKFIGNNEFHLISLLRGVDYPRLNEYWNVLIP